MSIDTVQNTDYDPNFIVFSFILCEKSLVFFVIVINLMSHHPHL